MSMIINSDMTCACGAPIFSVECLARAHLRGRRLSVDSYKGPIRHLLNEHVQVLPAVEPASRGMHQCTCGAEMPQWQRHIEELLATFVVRCITEAVST